MITKVFSVYDSKATFFGPPFVMQSHGEAIRAFTDLANDERTTVCKHPSDFVLYQIAEYDDQSGEMKSVNPHLHLGLAADFKKRPEPRFTIPNIPTESNSHVESNEVA